jgi:hypothetical protein
MRFEVLMMANIKIIIFWDIMPCCLVNGYQCFGGTWSLPLHGRKIL